MFGQRNLQLRGPSPSERLGMTTQQLRHPTYAKSPYFELAPQNPMKQTQ